MKKITKAAYLEFCKNYDGVNGDFGVRFCDHFGINDDYTLRECLRRSDAMARIENLYVKSIDISLDDEAAGKVGTALAELFHLKIKSNGRYDMEGGDKFPAGLARTVLRVIEENL